MNICYSSTERSKCKPAMAKWVDARGETQHICEKCLAFNLDVYYHTKSGRQTWKAVTQDECGPGPLEVDEQLSLPL